MDSLYVRVHPRDNVAIIVNPEGLPSGTEFPDGLRLKDSIPQAHKVALHEIGMAEPIVRYSQNIGFANRPIPAGAWVREEMLDLPAAPALDALPLATAVPPRLPELAGYTFEGYRNTDGSVGTRNILGITTTVQCVAPTVEHAVKRIRSEILPHFPGVDDVAAITHSYGCGVAIDAPGAAVPIRTCGTTSAIPTSAPRRWWSAGCEKLQPSNYADQRLPSASVSEMRCSKTCPMSFACRIRSCTDSARWWRPSCASPGSLEELDRRRRWSAPLPISWSGSVRRKRCVLRRHLQSGPGIFRRPSG